MRTIVISYRREDASDAATHICEYLARQFGRENVFMDVDSIPAGVDFRQYLQDIIRRSDVILVVIGPDWLEDRLGNRRLHDPGDFVRIEVEVAFEHNKVVIPVLVRNASMPTADQLPDSIRELAFCNAVPVRASGDFRRDMSRLIRELQYISDQPESSSVPVQPAPHSVASLVAGPQRVTMGSQQAQPGKIMVNSIGMRLAEIPAGEFLMGSHGSDTVASNNEKPQHRVRITSSFHLGMYLVTQAHYERTIGSNPSYFAGHPDCPVEMVSWNDAQAFCQRLSTLAEEEAKGYVYRLPTEAEWEYACRAGSAVNYCFGDSAESLGDYAWYSSNSDGRTHRVGQKKPNGWGLFDMHGNVWEWCADWYGHYMLPQDDPKGPDSGTFRVLRGGSWFNWDGDCRCANRSRFPPGGRLSRFGFRVAATRYGKEVPSHVESSSSGSGDQH